MAHLQDNLSSTFDHKRVCPVVSKKASFALAAIVTGVGIILLTLYTSGETLSPNLAFKAISSLADYKHIKLLHSFWSSDGGNVSVSLPEQLRDMKGVQLIQNTTSFPFNHQLSNVSTQKNNSTVNVTKINNSTVKLHHQDKMAAKVGPITTTMTFNKSLEISCVETPFIKCTPPVVTVKTDKIFKVSFLRAPSWYPTNSAWFGQCPYKQCQLVELAEKPDLVIVYGVNLRDDFKPPQRWSHQLYAVCMWESPVHTHADYLSNEKSVWNSQFNLTQGYRVDSDIFSPYNWLKYNPKDLDKRPNYYEIAKTKTRTAVWLVSHCETHSARMKYVREMQKHMDVDILGSCGTPCSSKGVDCDNITKYKFYLSFENSLCTDYITEKFFKIFTPEMYIIPVARGGADYDKYFPSFTFINAAHFKTPKDLALHLKDLASDLVTYSKYLEYKDLYTKLSPGIEIPCSVCKYLHTHNLSESKTYNLKTWAGDGHCHSPTDL